MTTARLKLPEITQSQASKHLTHNEALAMLDIYAGASLNSVTTATPPSVPVEGSAFFIPEGATGDWAPNEGKIAFRFNAEWHYMDLPTGWIFEILDEERVVVARASGIADVGGGSSGGGGITGKTYVDISGGDATVTDLKQVLQIGGSYTGGVTVTLPAVEQFIVAANDSDQGVTLTTGAGGTIYLEPGYQFVVFGDGTGIRAGMSIAPQGLKLNGDLILPIYSTASAPDPTSRYMVMIGVTDGDAGGPCLAVSDGGSWKRVVLGATISAT